MDNVISLPEIRIKMALKEAEIALFKAKTLVSEGENVPKDIIPKLEEIIDNLEKQLRALIEKNP
jgi:hypothetical protein